MSRYRQNIRAAELVTPDHWPVCYRCREYSEPDATVCGTCCAPLAPKADLEFVASMRAQREETQP